MKIVAKAVAGTIESNDIFVEISPAENGITVEIKSIVYNQFAEAIEKTISESLKEFGVENALVNVNDRGAVDFVIKARMETAILRAAGGRA